MAATKLSLAQFAIKTATKNYLTGVGFAVAFRMQGMVKSVEARDLIDKAAGDVDAVTSKAVKSLQQAISNQWNFGGEVLAKFSADDRKAINACGDNGMMERIIGAMESHMQKLGFNAFTLGNLKEFYGFNSAEEIAEHRAMMEKKEAEEAAKVTEVTETADTQTAIAEQAAQGKAATKSERSIANDAMAILATATRDDAMSVIRSLSATLGNIDLVALIGGFMENMPADECGMIADMVASRKAAIVVVNDAASVETTLATSKAAAKAKKLKSFGELAAA